MGSVNELYYWDIEVNARCNIFKFKFEGMSI